MKKAVAFAHGNAVVVIANTGTTCGAVLSIREAHEYVTKLLGAIDNAQGHQDVLDGKVNDPATCPRCKARSITANHACKRVKGVKLNAQAE